MTLPRKALISLDATPYYHCVSRCVRRAFLCGTDHFTKKSYEHRRDWLESKMLSLSKVFCIDIAAYAIMHNHYHVVLHINQMETESLSVDDIILRWHALFKGNLLSKKYAEGQFLSEAEFDKLLECVDSWRERLSSISWFMRMLNE